MHAASDMSHAQRGRRDASQARVARQAPYGERALGLPGMDSSRLPPAAPCHVGWSGRAIRAVPVITRYWDTLCGCDPEQEV